MRKDIAIPWIVWIIGVLAMAGGFIFCHVVLPRTNAQNRSVTAPQNIAATVNSETPDPCHHAVTCGGVHTAPGPNYKRIILPYNIWGFVTYRKDGKIYSTKKERMVPKGTAVWEDELGNIVLEKCGNMLTQYPNVVENLGTEPEDIFPAVPPDVTDVPPDVPVSGIPPSPPTSPTPPDTPTPPSYPTPPCCGGIVPPVTPPIHVAEPSSFALVLIGIGILLVWSRLCGTGRNQMEERREFPRNGGRITQIEDRTYEILREHNMNVAEPEARCTDCGAPLECGHKCEHC